MGLIKLALRSLKTDFLKSLFYFLSFVLTTVFIFLFFNLAYNPNSGIDLGGGDKTLVTPIAVFVILVAMICVFMANDYYVMAKTKDVSIVLMSGASVYQVAAYLFIQSTIIMLLAIPLGFLISYILVPVINSIFFTAFSYQGDLNYISNNTLIATAIILFCEIGWCTLLNVGYCYRTNINKMLSDSVKIESFNLGVRPLSDKLYLCLFILPMLIFPFLEDTASHLLLSVVGMIGVYGLIKNVIPQYIEKRQANQSLEDRYALIALGNVKYDLQKVRMLVLVNTMAAILLMCLTVYTLNQPLVSMISLMSYFSIMVLLSITTIFKVGMELQNRKKSFLHLYHLGYELRDLKKIISMEMIIFYGLIIVIPLMYQVIIVTKLGSLGLINGYLMIIILLIQVIPMLSCSLLCTKMYQKILPEKTI